MIDITSNINIYKMDMDVGITGENETNQGRGEISREE